MKRSRRALSYELDSVQAAIRKEEGVIRDFAERLCMWYS